MDLLEKFKGLDRIKKILIVIILSTFPCYCLGLGLLWSSNLNRSPMTPSPAATNETPDGTPTLTFTVDAGTSTPTLTPTQTLTFTPTTTFSIPPTNTPSPSPTLTASPSPTATETPTITLTPTNTATETPSPTVTP